MTANMTANIFASDPPKKVLTSAPRLTLAGPCTLFFMQNLKVKLIPRDTKKDPSRFNSVKWLQILPNLEEVRTNSERIIVLPSFSIHPRDKGNCEIKFRVDGEQKSISSGTRNKREAEARAKPLLARWLAAHGKVSAQGKTSLQAAIDAFLETQYANTKPATKTEASLVMRRLAEAFPVDHVQEISPDVFRKGATAYRGDASPKYWMNILSITRRFSRSLLDQGKIAQDFTKGIPSPRKSQFGRREGVWTDEELETAFRFINSFDRDVFLVMRWAGLDSSDVFELRKKHLVKDDSGAWMFRKRREKSKTEEETILQPVSSVIRDMILAKWNSAKGAEDRLFQGPYINARSFTASLMSRFRRATATAGVTFKDLKSLRHTFASYHAERGVPLDVLRVWMGHARDSRVLDRIYVHRASTARFMD